MIGQRPFFFFLYDLYDNPRLPVQFPERPNPKFLVLHRAAGNLFGQESALWVLRCKKSAATTDAVDQLLEDVPDAIVILDAHGRIVRV
jgi:hypothetical protein